MLEEQELADEDFVYHQRKLYGNADADAEEFWTDIGVLDHNDLKRASSGNMEESIMNGPDWVFVNSGFHQWRSSTQSRQMNPGELRNEKKCSSKLAVENGKK